MAEMAFYESYQDMIERWNPMLLLRFFRVSLPVRVSALGINNNLVWGEQSCRAPGVYGQKMRRRMQAGAEVEDLRIRAAFFYDVAAELQPLLSESIAPFVTSVFRNRYKVRCHIAFFETSCVPYLRRGMPMHAPFRDNCVAYTLQGTRAHARSLGKAVCSGQCIILHMHSSKKLHCMEMGLVTICGAPGSTSEVVTCSLFRTWCGERPDRGETAEESDIQKRAALPYC